jgi:hypothetical protein
VNSTANSTRFELSAILSVIWNGCGDLARNGTGEVHPLPRERSEMAGPAPRKNRGAINHKEVQPRSSDPDRKRVSEEFLLEESLLRTRSGQGILHRALAVTVTKRVSGGAYSVRVDLNGDLLGRRRLARLFAFGLRPA